MEISCPNRKYKHLDQDTLNKLRNGFTRKETMLFKRYKNGDADADAEMKNLMKKEKELEQAAHTYNLYWY